MARLLKNAAKDIADAFTRWNLWQGGGGASTLSDLNDVSINNPQADEVLQFNGTDWVNAIVSGGSLGGKVETIWSNPSPLSIFNEQTISINTNYDIFIVHFRPTNTSGTNFTLCLNKVFNRTYYLICNSGDSQDYQLMRAITFSENLVQFGGGLRPGIEFGNQFCIPTTIYGIKFAPIEEINASDVKIPIYGNVDAAIDSHDVQLAALDDDIIRIDTKLDGENWKYLTSQIEYIKYGNVVTVKTIGYGLAASTTLNIIGTLPEGYRPRKPIYANGYCGSYRSINMSVTIETNGNISIAAASYQQYGGFSITYII